MCAVPNMAAFCSPLISCFPDMLLRYCLSDHEIVPVTPITTGITFALLSLLSLLLLLLLLLLLHEHLRRMDVFCLLWRYTYGIASFIACSRQLEKNCVLHVHSPSTGSIIPFIVVFVMFSLCLSKLVTLNRCSAPLPGNHLSSRMPVPSIQDRQEMMTHHLSPSAPSHATYSKYDGGKKVLSSESERELHLPEFSSSESLSVQQESARCNRWPLWVWLRIVSQAGKAGD